MQALGNHGLQVMLCIFLITPVKKQAARLREIFPSQRGGIALAFCLSQRQNNEVHIFRRRK